MWFRVGCRQTFSSMYKKEQVARLPDYPSCAKKRRADSGQTATLLGENGANFRGEHVSTCRERDVRKLGDVVELSKKLGEYVAANKADPEPVAEPALGDAGPIQRTRSKDALPAHG